MLSERLTTFTPLGIRFWDPVLDSQVRDGLEATIWPEGQTYRAVHAFRTGSGVYAFQNLPGLRAIEYPAEDGVEDGMEFSAIEPRRFIVEVEDSRYRFLPVRFGVWLPITEYRGIYRPGNLGSPPDSAEPRFYLFSSPARMATFGIATIRSQVVEVDEDGNLIPAAYAFIEAEVDNQLHYSYTDQRGCFVILFPYPPADSANGSPPGVSMADQSWPVTIRIQYQSKSSPELDLLWEFGRIRAQPTALIHDSTTVFETEPFRTLRYGQELNLITTGPETRSTLWVRPS
jgi:hypothetical protein